jgi:hypothetical protein
MDDMHDYATELALETDGSIISEQEAKVLTAPAEIDYPMPGETPTKEEESLHSHHMPGIEDKPADINTTQ